MPLVKWFFQVLSESGGGWSVTAMPMLLTRVITRNSPMPMHCMMSATRVPGTLCGFISVTGKWGTKQATSKAPSAVALGSAMKRFCWTGTSSPRISSKPSSRAICLSVGCVKARARTRGGSAGAAATISCTASIRRDRGCSSRRGEARYCRRLAPGPPRLSAAGRCQRRRCAASARSGQCARGRRGALLWWRCIE
jgi:hypothetical protein